MTATHAQAAAVVADLLTAHAQDRTDLPQYPRDLVPKETP